MSGDPTVIRRLGLLIGMVVVALVTATARTLIGSAEAWVAAAIAATAPLVDPSEPGWLLAVLVPPGIIGLAIILTTIV